MSGKPVKIDELHDGFIFYARIFARAPSERRMYRMIDHYTAFHLIFVGSDKGLNEEVAKIEANARNVMAGRP